MAIYNENLSGGVNAKDCTADASKILDGYTAAVCKEIVTGTMPNNGDASTAVVNGAVLEGYTSGGQIEGLTAENIKNGVVVGGVSGTSTPCISGYIDYNPTDDAEYIPLSKTLPSNWQMLYFHSRYGTSNTQFRDYVIWRYNNTYSYTGGSTTIYTKTWNSSTEFKTGSDTVGFCIQDNTLVFYARGDYVKYISNVKIRIYY